VPEAEIVATLIEEANRLAETMNEAGEPAVSIGK
jgi:(E)-4-hydroxy-3-methylbut-2-enyl-diphosphate synthase